MERQWSVDEKLKAGRWHYTNYECEKGIKFILVIPLMVCILRSAYNVQLCDVMFMVSYLVKYVVGKESRPHANFNMGKNNEVKIDNTNTDDVNQKISGVKIRNKNKLNKNEDMTNNIMQVGLIEICYNVLDYDYTY